MNNIIDYLCKIHECQVDNSCKDNQTDSDLLK